MLSRRSLGFRLSTYLPTVIVVLAIGLALGAGLPLAGLIAVVGGLVVEGVAYEQWDKRRR